MHNKFQLHLFYPLLIIQVVFGTALAVNEQKIHVININTMNYIPTFKAKIKGKNITLLFDSGATTTLILHNKILKNVKDIKKTGKNKKYIDALGKINTLDENVIPELKINSFILQNVITFPYQSWGLKITNGTTTEKNGYIPNTFHDKQDGIAGIQLFSKTKLILDYQNQKIIIFSGNELPAPYSSREWAEAKFKVDEDGLTVYGNMSNIKTGKFILDTGATASILHSRLVKDHNKKSFKTDLTFSSFTVKEHLFQMANFQEPNVDGILGYNFFEKTIVFIDLLNEKLYFS